jgi:hypothetical protein
LSSLFFLFDECLLASAIRHYTAFLVGGDILLIVGALVLGRTVEALTLDLHD